MMKFVIVEGSNRERVSKLSTAMADKCYEASRLMSEKSDFSRAFWILGRFVGALGSPTFCESDDIMKRVQLFLAASQSLGRSKSESRIIMRFCLDAIRASFSDSYIFRVRDDFYYSSIPILIWVDNWLAREDSTLEEL